MRIGRRDRIARGRVDFRRKENLSLQGGEGRTRSGVVACSLPTPPCPPFARWGKGCREGRGCLLAVHPPAWGDEKSVRLRWGVPPRFVPPWRPPPSPLNPSPRGGEGDRKKAGLSVLFPSPRWGEGARRAGEGASPQRNKYGGLLMRPTSSPRASFQHLTDTPLCKGEFARVLITLHFALCTLHFSLPIWARASPSRRPSVSRSFCSRSPSPLTPLPGGARGTGSLLRFGLVWPLSPVGRGGPDPSLALRAGMAPHPWPLSPSGRGGPWGCAKLGGILPGSGNARRRAASHDALGRASVLVFLVRL